jgi:hypothetical protein
MITNFRIIGDVHGHYERYHLLLRKAKFTLQIGDFGFDYSTLASVDSERHRIIGGNHDNYDEVGKCPNFLGNYGVHSVPGFGDLFFVRGAFSIDRHQRIEGLDWWPEEELPMRTCYDALEEYMLIQPDFVVTHACPTTIVPHVTASLHIKPARTCQLLEQMFAFHQPKRWVFGHYHRSWSKTIDGTSFTCLDELECLDF